jgi:DNA-directed RNA polymerase specialized sigma24 family protein
LPEEQRDIFVANEFENLSFKEISEKTGVGINTLISRKRYAVLALRQKLAELYNLLKNN